MARSRKSGIRRSNLPNPLLLALILAGPGFAGCLGSGPGADSNLPTDPTLPIDEPFDLSLLKPQLVDCKLFPTLYRVPRGDLRPHTPAGYTPHGFIVGDPASLHLDVIACKSIILDNETVISPASLALTRGDVWVNDTIGGPTPFHSYLYELFTTDARIRDVFHAAGLPGTLADISVEKNQVDTRFAVRVNGTVWYETQIHGELNKNPPALTFILRNHFLTDGKRPSWADFKETFTEDGWSAITQVHEGFIKSVRPGDQGLIVGGGAVGTTKGLIEFGHL